MKIRNSAITLIFALCVILASISCGKLNSNDSTNPLEPNLQSAVNQMSSSIVKNQIASLKSAGVDLDSVDAIFELGWLPDIADESRPLIAQAFAIAINKAAEQDPSQPFGFDMGSVTLSFDNEQVELLKTENEFGIFYDLVGPISEDNYQDSTSREPKIQIPFNAGGTYGYNVSGSNEFPAVSIELTAPTEWVSLTSPGNGDLYTVGEALKVTWTGGQPGDSLYLAIFTDFNIFDKEDDHENEDDEGDDDDGDDEDDDDGEDDEDEYDPGSNELDLFGEERIFLVDASAGQHTIPADFINEILSEENDEETLMIAISSFEQSVVQQNDKTLLGFIHIGDLVELNVQ